MADTADLETSYAELLESLSDSTLRSLLQQTPPEHLLWQVAVDTIGESKLIELGLLD